MQEKVRKCEKCQLNQKTPALAALHPWEWPRRPWARIHIDHAGPFQGKLFLVVVDAHSKWLDVVTVPSTTSQATVKAFKPMFACHGLPELIVSDNGTAFTSLEFQEFLKRNGVRHITSAPYHPATNGLAERAVQSFKEGLKKSADGDIETRLARFLFHYQTTPHTTTGITPAELLMGRKLRSHLDLLQPDLSSRVLVRQTAQKTEHDKYSKERSLEMEDQVYVRGFGNGPRWIPGTIVKVHGSRSFEIKLSDGRMVRRHLDHIRLRTNDVSDELLGDLPIDTPPNADAETDNPPETDSPPEIEPRRSTRHRQPPDRYTSVLN